MTQPTDYVSSGERVKDTANKLVEGLQKPGAAYLFAIAFLLIFTVSLYYEELERKKLIKTFISKVEESRHAENMACTESMKEMALSLFEEKQEGAGK